MRTVQPNDPRTPSVQIADDLRKRVEAEEFAPGMQLPAITNLADQYGVAQMTARAAVKLLVAEGRVVASSRGHFVAEVQPASTPTLDDRLEALEAEVRELRSRMASLEASQ
jgi:DNA-binding GntR family transcriptional regulator